MARSSSVQLDEDGGPGHPGHRGHRDQGRGTASRLSADVGKDDLQSASAASSETLPGLSPVMTTGPGSMASPGATADTSRGTGSKKGKSPAPQPASARKSPAFPRRHGIPPHVEKQWYSKSEAEEYLGRDETTITRALQDGTLHAQRLPNHGPKAKSNQYNYGRLRFHKSELNRYLASIDRKPNDAVTQGPAGDAEAGEVGEADVGRDKGHIGIEDNGITSQSLAGPDKMTRDEAAQALSVSWRTIKRLVERGELPSAGLHKCRDGYIREHVFRADVRRLLGQ